MGLEWVTISILLTLTLIVILNEVKNPHDKPPSQKSIFGMILILSAFTILGLLLVSILPHDSTKILPRVTLTPELVQIATGGEDNPYEQQPLTPLPETSTLGPLQVSSDNPRYFADTSGKVVYLTGSHTWNDFIDCGNTAQPPAFDYDGYLDFLVANNHNFFRLWRAENSRGGETGDNCWFDPMPYQRTGPGTAFDGKLRFDVTQFDQDYFDRMRNRVMEAGQRGIYVSIMLFDGWSIESKIPNHNPWDGHPFNSSNNINGIDGDLNGDAQGEETHTLQSAAIIDLQEAYVRKVIDTVNDLDNVLYEISNESPGNSQDWQYHLIELIKGYEATKPSQHPVGMTAEWPEGDNDELFASPADWISPNGDVNNPPAASSAKVILNDTDHLCGICGDRQWVWKSFTRGVNPIFMDPYDTQSQCRGGPPGYDPDNANDMSIRENLGYTLTFANRMNLISMLPSGDLCSTGYCLANPIPSGAEYLAYLPSGGQVEVDLSQASGTLEVEWFNPDNGITINSDPIAGGASQNFTAPFSEDAVLYLYQASPPTEFMKIFVPVIFSQ